MKRRTVVVLAGALWGLAGSAMASSGSLTEFRPKVLPVLVQVSAAGKVTSASPAYPLDRRFSRLLNQSLAEMITQPAHEGGRAVSSQFVINLALDVEPRQQGDYDARFVYVSTQPVPLGVWHWVHTDGYQLALAGPNNHRFNVERQHVGPPENRLPIGNSVERTPTSSSASGNKQGR